jgi:hypothetical protein
MSRYSIHFVKSDGQTSVQPEALDCIDDTQAKARARQRVGPNEDVELWDGHRLVELFPHT